MSAQIPVTIITGFLGSGKTTLVNHILTNTQGLKFAVIENEFGEVGIDDALISLANHTQDDDEQVVEMMNGCICCTVRSDLVRILKKLIIVEKRRFDAIVIEMTGLADPAPVAQTFFVDDELSKVCVLDAIVTVVDAKHILQHLDEVKPDGVENEAVEQVAFADRIVLNKVDLVTATKLENIRERLRALAGAAEIIETEQSRVAIEKIINTQCFSLERILEFEPSFLPTKTVDPATGQVVVVDEDEHQHDAAVSSVSIVLDDAPVHIARLQQWLQGLLRTQGADLFRYKGVLSVQGVEDAKFVFQGIHMLFSGCFVPVDPASALASNNTSKFVFIGKHLDRERLRRGFEACVIRPGVTPLRFTVGTKVEALVGMDEDEEDGDEEDRVRGRFVAGEVVALWDDGNPYRIRLEKSGIQVWAPVDDDALVRLPQDSR